MYAYIGRLPNSGTTNFHTLSTKILSWNFEGTDVWNSLLHHPITSVTESQPNTEAQNRKIEKHNKHYKPHSHAGIRRNKSDWNIRKNHSYMFIVWRGKWWNTRRKKKCLVFTELDFRPWEGLCCAFESNTRGIHCKIALKKKNVKRLIALLQMKRDFAFLFSWLRTWC